MDKASRLGLLLAVLILLLGFGLRVVNLEQTPPGVTHDEAAHLHDAQRIADGYRPLYLTTAYGREPLFDYLTAPLVATMGMTRWTGRLAAAFWGTLLLALTYALTRRVFDRDTALIALVLMAFSFWPLATSRQILRSICMPVLLTAALTCFWRALYPREGRWVKGYVLAGFLMGLAFYSYMPARITWLVPALLGGSLALLDRPRWRRERLGLLWMLVSTFVVAAPLLLFLAQHPELEVRVDELAAPLWALFSGQPGPLWQRVREAALMFSQRGDTQWIYNLAGRPLLPPVLAVLFYGGLAAAGANFFKRPAPGYRLLVIWLLLGISPALATGMESSSLRAIAAQPAVYILAALPMAWLWRWLKSRPNAWWGRIGVALAAAAALILAWQSATAYFGDWSNSRDTRVAYHSHLVDIAAYLDNAPSEMAVVISSLYPGRFHDPAALDVLSDRSDLALTWVDARYALAFPPADSALLLYPASATLGAELAGLIAGTSSELATVPLREDDLDAWFRIVGWQPQEVLGGLNLEEPVDFDHLLAFRGAIVMPAAGVGDVVTVLTFWQPVGAPETDAELVLFTHLLADGQVVAQDDRLDVPTEWWGGVGLFVQLHRFALPEELASGAYDLEIGAYWRESGYPRLSIINGPAAGADSLLLPALQVP